MKLDYSITNRTSALAYAMFDVPWSSDDITNEIYRGVNGHVWSPLRDMGLDWEPRWSERGEYAYLKEEWGYGYGT